MNHPRIAVIDYGAGNLRSVAKALESVGADPVVSGNPKELLEAEGVVFPGQGAGNSAMDALISKGLVQPIRDIVANRTPFLGICLGLQLLVDSTDEGNIPCLGLLPGKVRRLPDLMKVPHMGWNNVHFLQSHPFLANVPNDSLFYFVHSYYLELTDPKLVVGVTDYGLQMCSVVGSENLMATQFHPEKSGEVGLQIYRNFVQFIADQSILRK